MPADFNVEESRDVVKSRFTDEYVEVIKRELPWMARLAIARDDETLEWSACFLRGGEECFAQLGSEIPKSPLEFVNKVKEGIALAVDMTKMEELAKQMEEWDDEEVDET